MTDPRQYIGASVVDKDGDKVGKVVQVYLDDTTSDPAWITVGTGLLSHKEKFVPLTGVTGRPDSELRVAYDKKTITDAPAVESDGELSTADARRLAHHYRIDTADAERTTTTGRSTEEGALTRSEERLHVGKERVETDQVRLRKYVVTDEEQVSVPVSHEEVRIERTPVTDRGSSDATIGEQEATVTLHAERPVVSTEAVAVEEIRLGKETVTENETVSGTVRKEHVEIDGDDRPSAR